MFSVFLRMKMFLVKKVAIDSISPLVFQHNRPFLLRRISSSTSRTSYLPPRSRLTDSCDSPATLEKDPSSRKGQNQDSYAISYLVNSCGLSPEVAISVSKNLSFQIPEKPDAVLNLLKQQGFTKTQISTVVRKHPLLLVSDVKTTLLPKFQFLQSIGFSRVDLAKILAYDPRLLKVSLKNRLIPSYNLLKSVIQSDRRVVLSIMRRPYILRTNYEKDLLPNITLLRETRIPESKISLLLTYFPNTMILNNSHIRKTVDEVKEMGFDPLKSSFVLALRALSGSYKLVWNRSYGVYRQWGWSNDEILSAFRTHPQCMLLSEKKITKAMNFLVKNMGWNYQMIVRCPTVLLLSLEKRMIPRCSVVQVLLSKGLVKKDLSLASVLVKSEKHFLDRFVVRFEEEVPLLLNVYQGKMDFSELI